uniref:Uncharacterized protein n=1 Tax=Timema tahoe TaxID=61484 RepID=A0A7R9ILX8_9NEOP|nr:unnamed protein product [Timema tahoe]
MGHFRLQWQWPVIAPRSFRPATRRYFAVASKEDTGWGYDMYGRVPPQPTIKLNKARYKDHDRTRIRSSKMVSQTCHWYYQPDLALIATGIRYEDLIQYKNSAAVASVSLDFDLSLVCLSTSSDCQKRPSEKKESGKPFWGQTLSTPDQELNLYLPVIGSLVYCERSTLDHAATEANSVETAPRRSQCLVLPVTQESSRASVRRAPSHMTLGCHVPTPPTPLLRPFVLYDCVRCPALAGAVAVFLCLLGRIDQPQGKKNIRFRIPLSVTTYKKGSQGYCPQVARTEGQSALSQALSAYLSCDAGPGIDTTLKRPISFVLSKSHIRSLINRTRCGVRAEMITARIRHCREEFFEKNWWCRHVTHSAHASVQTRSFSMEPGDSWICEEFPVQPWSDTSLVDWRPLFWELASTNTSRNDFTSDSTGLPSAISLTS